MQPLIFSELGAPIKQREVHARSGLAAGDGAAQAQRGHGGRGGNVCRAAGPPGPGARGGPARRAGRPRAKPGRAAPSALAAVESVRLTFRRPAVHSQLVNCSKVD